MQNARTSLFSFRKKQQPATPVVMPQGAPVFASVAQALKEMAPEGPVRLWHPQVLARKASHIVATFPGICHYAVKCNPEPFVLKALHQAGVSAFDVASLGEVQAVAENCPGARMAFMHPVKSPHAIEQAYHRYGVRHFVLDHPTELTKILKNTGNPKGLTLIVRLAVTNPHAACPLEGKFGAKPELAAQLLRQVVQSGCRTGISFHVGSQCLEPSAYTSALGQAAQVARHAGVALSVINVGGGFPVPMQDASPPPFASFVAAVERGLAENPEFTACELWAEPGRALVAESGSLLTRVELRKDSVLYLNDGTYGGIFEGGPLVGLRYPAHTYRAASPLQGKLAPFTLFGPTCDSVDKLPGPFLLPENITEGDWLHLEQLGAYSQATRTAFNGFPDAPLAMISSAAHQRRTIVDEFTHPTDAS